MDALIQQHDVKTTTYLHNGFLLDVVERPDMIEAWLGHPDYGTKHMMFGLSPESLRTDELGLMDVFLKHTLNSLPEYEKDYADKYFD